MSFYKDSYTFELIKCGNMGGPQVQKVGYGGRH